MGFQEFEDVSVNAPAGTVIGLRTGDVEAYRGIRYAEPPVGEHRFAATADRATVETIDARSFAPMSLQDIDPLPPLIPAAERYHYPADAVTSEDCLYLNVWTPTGAKDAPVFLWIHGGGFRWGSGTGSWTDGEQFARDHGVVVVTLNYRLGILGGLWLADLDPTASNLAVQDQISALRWVQRNIRSFGGDPARVTIGGHSAGAMSTVGLMMSPKAQGLFSAAFVDSGHAMTVPVEDALAVRERVFELLHLDKDGDVLEQLRSMSTLRLLQVQRDIGVDARLFPRVGDAITLPTDPLKAVREGRFAPVSMLIGSTAEEDRTFALVDQPNHRDSVRELVQMFISDTEEAERVTKLYEDNARDDEARQFLVTTDRNWGMPIRALARAWADAGNPVFHWVFAHRSNAVNGRAGAGHMLDVPFFWNTIHQDGMAALLGDDLDSPAVTELSKNVNGSLARFVQTGTPDGGPLGYWPEYTAQHPVTMVMDTTPHLELDHAAERLDAWGGIRRA